MVLPSDIALARRHIADAEKRIADQEARVQRLAKAHQPTDMAEDLLRLLREALDGFQVHLVTMEADESARVASSPKDDTRA